jgi:hypothetical protein
VIHRKQKETEMILGKSQEIRSGDGEPGRDLDVDHQDFLFLQWRKAEPDNATLGSVVMLG